LICIIHAAFYVVRLLGQSRLNQPDAD
jgi:hypothetical protein